jgi:hypothetical protein
MARPSGFSWLGNSAIQLVSTRALGHESGSRHETEKLVQEFVYPCLDWLPSTMMEFSRQLQIWDKYKWHYSTKKSILCFFFFVHTGFPIYARAISMLTKIVKIQNIKPSHSIEASACYGVVVKMNWRWDEKFLLTI